MQKIKHVKTWNCISHLILGLLSITTTFCVNAQTQSLIIGPTSGPGDYFKGPIYRFGNNANTANYSRYAYLYSSSELAAPTSGTPIPSGAKIVKVEWLKRTGGTVTGNNNFNVWMANTTQTAFSTTGEAWSTLENGTTQTFGSSTFPVLIGNDQWLDAGFNLPPNDSFVYSGGNLKILTDWGKVGSASGTINWYVSTINALNKAIGIAGANALTGSTVLSSTNYGNSRPTIRITYVPVPPCSGIPETGPVIASAPAACPGESFSLSITNTIPGSGVSFVWQSADDSLFTVNVQNLGSFSTLVTSQTVQKFYRCIAQCSGSGLNDTTEAFKMLMSPHYGCYCQSSAISTADEDIFNFTFGSLNNSSNCTTTAPGFGSVGQLYSNYTNFTTIPAVEKNSVVPFSLQIGTCANFYPNRSIIFIDYNHNSIFEPSERVYSSPNAFNGPHFETGSVLIPPTAQTGITGLRVIVSEQIAPINDTTGQCGLYSWGETEDYLVEITPTTICAGTPNPGNTIPNQPTVCTGGSVTLTVQNLTTGQGVGYQWYRNGDLIPGATNMSHTSAPITSATSFFCVVGCNLSGSSANSTPVTITLNSFIDCYCSSSAGNDADEDIFEVIIKNRAYSTDCSTTAPGPGSILGRYSNFYPYGNIDTFALGDVVPYSIEVDDCDLAPYYSFGTSIWIDFNQNGSFADPGEQVKIENIALEGPRFIIGTFKVPCTALPGQTAMRITIAEGVAGSTFSSCLSYGFGETEDYKIFLRIPQTCYPNFGSISGANTSSKINGIVNDKFCESTVAELSVSNVTFTNPSTPDVCFFEPLISYQWLEVLPLPNPPIVIAGATNSTYTVNVNSTRTFRCRLYCGTDSILSAPRALIKSDMTSLSLTPSFGTYCSGGIQDTLKAIGISSIPGPIAYNYTPIDGLISSTGPTVFAAPLVTTTYTVTATNAAGCTLTSVTTVNATTLVMGVNASASNYCFPGGTPITLSGFGLGQGNISYTYSPVSSLDTNVGPIVLASPATTTTYTLTAVDETGCTGKDTITITSNPCSTIITIKLFLEGYYVGLNTMSPVLLNQLVGNSLTETDTVNVILHESTAPFNIVSMKKTVLGTNGILIADFPAVTGSFYIEIEHRSSVSTWSANPVPVSSGFYDFTDSASKAFGNNMREIEPGIFAFYAGDIVKDAGEIIDLADIATLELANLNFDFGYVAADIDGDGSVSLTDFPLVETNNANFIFVNKPTP